MAQDMITIHELTFRHHTSREELERAIARVAEQINEQYGPFGRVRAVADSHDDVPLMVVTLSGAMMFAAQLLKGLNFHVELAFVKCSSYDQNIVSGGAVKFEVPITRPVTGRQVIIIEDIVDTGNTYAALNDYLIEQGASSVEIASLLFKREAYQHQLAVHYVAMEIENLFVVGYGLDYKQLGRNLDSLYILDR